MRKCLAVLAAATLLVGALPAAAGNKLLATGGASPIEGGGGGGLSPWALIAGYGSSSEWGVTAFATAVDVDDYRLDAYGAAFGWGDRLELSYTRQTFEVDALDLDLEQDIFGAKLRVAGALLYTALPQISVGVQHKRNDTMLVPELLGARDDRGTDVYLAASKLFFAALGGRNLLLNGLLRRTEANETGLLGFGGVDGDASLVAEASAVLFLDDHWVLGYEYRQKPDHLDAVGESDWQDLFVGWFPNKRIGIVAAWADLDEIAGAGDQRGAYLSLQLSH